MNVRMLKLEDTKILEDFLFPHRAECMFICSNLKEAGIEYNGKIFQGEYFGYFDSDQLEGIIVHYWNGNIMIYSPNKKILAQLITYLKNNINRLVAGIIGLNAQAEQVITELRLSNEEFNINRNEELYKLDLDELIDIQLDANLKIVEAKEISKDLLFKWIVDFEIEALGSENGEALYRKVESRVERLIIKDCWILLSKSIPVSLCGFNARLDDMVQVGPVWTPPECRNNGFAKHLLSNILIEEKRNDIIKAILFTDNPLAKKLYESIGFKVIGDYRLALLKEAIDVKA